MHECGDELAMEQEESAQRLVRLLISGARLLLSVRDRFFSQRIRESLSFVVLAAIRAHSGEESRRENVAQYYDARRELLSALGHLAQTLEELDYLELAPVLFLRRMLFQTLRLKFLTLRKRVPRPRQEQKPAVQKQKQKQAELVARTSIIRKTPRLTENQERILGFIRQSEVARAKDIVDEFNALSERTVKRNLKELMSSGLVQKRLENRAVFYLPASE